MCTIARMVRCSLRSDALTPCWILRYLALISINYISGAERWAKLPNKIAWRHRKGEAMLEWITFPLSLVCFLPFISSHFRVFCSGMKIPVAHAANNQHFNPGVDSRKCNAKRLQRAPGQPEEEWHRGHWIMNNSLSQAPHLPAGQKRRCADSNRLRIERVVLLWRHLSQIQLNSKVLAPIPDLLNRLCVSTFRASGSEVTATGVEWKNIEKSSQATGLGWYLFASWWSAWTVV